MTDRKDLPIGRLIFEEIAADASFDEHIALARQGSHKYRPGKACTRPSVKERTDAGKRRWPQVQLELDFYRRHFAQPKTRTLRELPVRPRRILEI